MAKHFEDVEKVEQVITSMGTKKTNLKTFLRFLTCGFGSPKRVVSSTSSMRETGDLFLHIYSSQTMKARRLVARQ